MNTAILVLAIVGALLLGAEILLPGGIMGLFGALSLLGAVVIVFLEHGALWGIVALLLSFVLCIGTFYFTIKLVEKTRLGKDVLLSETLKGAATRAQAPEDIVGKIGEVVTPMNPTGMASVDGALYEASSIDGSLDKGEKFVVAGQDNFRILVKKI